MVALESERVGVTVAVEESYLTFATYEITSAEKVPILPAEVVKLARLAFADGARTTRTRYVFTAPLAAVT
ncbi:unannotated protein [freshwater metagenome]|uniref:Unannotated protein n=1 Tax=freshwater metagenome TaxID=449393 RepID=A0A6J6R8E7_9ZZZZ